MPGKRIPVRLTTKEHETVVRMAGGLGLSVAGCIAMLCRVGSRHVVRDHGDDHGRCDMATTVIADRALETVLDAVPGTTSRSSSIRALVRTAIPIMSPIAGVSHPDAVNRKTRACRPPRQILDLLWSSDTKRIILPDDDDLVISAVMERGTPWCRRWLLRVYGAGHLASWLRGTRGSGLSETTCATWRGLLGVGRDETDLAWAH